MGRIHSLASPSLAHQSLTPLSLAAASKHDQGQPPFLEQRFFLSESTEPGGQKVPFLEQNIEKTERPGCSVINKHVQPWTACFMCGILESFL